MSDLVLSVFHVVGAFVALILAFVALILAALVLVDAYHPPQAMTETAALLALGYAMIAVRTLLKGGGR